MKTLNKVLKYTLAVFIVTYTMCSFYNVDINFANWDQDSRFICSFITTITFIAGGVTLKVDSKKD